MQSAVTELHLFKTHRFGLVDALARENLPAEWPQVVVAPDFLGRDTSRCPTLVDVSMLEQQDQDALLKRLHTECVDRESTLFSLLIASEQKLDRVAVHLAERMVIRLQQAGEVSQFRYFDPGTFLQLPKILGDEGMVWLMGQATSFAVPWAGYCSVYLKPKVSTPLTRRFVLTPEHLEALLDLSAVNRVATQLPAPTNQQDWIERCEQVRQHIRRAKQHGLALLADKVSFALHAVQHHPSFDQHDRIVQLLLTLKNSKPDDELDYQELSSRITPSEWKALSQELSSRQIHRIDN
jgi:Domain of unknown function (DUF4123)